MRQLPSLNQWKQIAKVLSKKEIFILLSLFAIACISFVVFVATIYFTNTHTVPAVAGTYTEGVLGQPRFINPLYGETNDIDRTLTGLLFSGLMTYDREGNLVPDLAETYAVSDNGKRYEFILKNNLFWHDGKPLTSDDIIFTIRTIQNSDYKSPLRANWLDIGIEKTSEQSIAFTLKRPYRSFLENTTVKIIPQHIWGSITPENATLSSYNLQPIGSGPYVFNNLEQDSRNLITKITLESNRRFHYRPAFIPQLSFQFYETKEALLQAAKNRVITGFSLGSSEDDPTKTETHIHKNALISSYTFNLHTFSLPRYFAVFFNSAPKNSLFTDENIRKAFSYAVNQEELIKKISSKESTISPVTSPILSDFFGYQSPKVQYTFDTEKAKALFDKAGFKLNNEGKRQKALNKKPAFEFKSYLKVGSKGTEVNQLQACLVRLGDTYKTILAKEKNGTYGKDTENAVTEFQKQYLPDQKPTGETGTATRKKLNEVCIPPSADNQPLAFTLTTLNQPQLLAVAHTIKEYWESVGATVTIQAVSLTDIKPIIKSRNYDALLYGEAFGAEPDLYPFWHSSQKIDPGLNLSGYDNKTVDQLLKEIRETTDDAIAQQKMEKVQDLILGNAPAIFLYNPAYLYWVSNDIQGIQTHNIIDPAKRFITVTDWYIKTKRAWK